MSAYKLTFLFEPFMKVAHLLTQLPIYLVVRNKQWSLYNAMLTLFHFLSSRVEAKTD